jgi:hypothetical protein
VVLARFVSLVSVLALMGQGCAHAETGVAPAIASGARGVPTPAIVRLVPNDVVEVGRSATVVLAWRFGVAEDCPLWSREQWERFGYCVDLDAGVRPHRCVVTTSKVTRHDLLGGAVQRCFGLSQVVAKQ